MPDSKVNSISIGRKTLNLTDQQILSIINNVNKLISEHTIDLLNKEKEEKLFKPKNEEEIVTLKKETFYNENVYFKYAILLLNPKIITKDTVETFITMSPSIEEQSINRSLMKKNYERKYLKEGEITCYEIFDDIPNPENRLKCFRFYLNYDSSISNLLPILNRLNAAIKGIINNNF
jgi:hypothetical protein